MEKTDIAIIGAGVVGCAIARELSLHHPKKRVIVLDKLPGAGLETSALNSGVLHSGLHQNPAFLKSRLACEGSALARAYMKEKALPILDCGMIVAVSASAIKSGLWKEIGAFSELLRRGREQNIRFEFLPSWRLRKLEPNLQALFGIFIPEVSVIDPKSLTEALKQDAERNGVHFYFEHLLADIERESGGYRLFTPRRMFFTKILINAGGLYADEIASMAGCHQYRIYPWRGEYYEVVGLDKNLVHRLIYPAVPHNYPGKGIHFSPRVDGRLFIGPNARPVPRKNYYEEDKTPVGEFLNAAQRFIPEIKEENLRWAYSGIRPKTVNVPAETDFVISLDRRSPPLLNLIGIESPGLASAMAIGKYAAETLKSVL